MSAKRLTGTEIELIHRLFFRGLTWDGDLPSRIVALHYVIAGSRNMNLVLCG